MFIVNYRQILLASLIFLGVTSLSNAWATLPALAGSGACNTYEGAFYDSATDVCRCAPGYDFVAVGSSYACRPEMIDFSFYQDSTHGYPVCGSGRIAVNENGSVSTISSSNRPNTSLINVTWNSKTYSFVKSASGDPKYAYEPRARCSCTHADYPYNPTSGPVVGTDRYRLSNIQIIPAETFDVISNQQSTNQLNYSPVAIALDSTGMKDGRFGEIFKAGHSKCRCPNFNEMPEPLLASDSQPQGAVCRPLIVDSRRILVKFDPAVHDIPGQSHVLNRADEPQISGVLVTKIALPVKVGKIGTLTYDRRIWACPNGMEIDPNDRICVFKPEKHMCGPQSGTTLASAVPDEVKGSTLDQRFENSINQKLSCCVASFTKGYSNMKFDCIQNLNDTASRNFNSLWASTDLAEDGGRLNALMLFDASGKRISGFYRLNGSRCEQYSEFSGTLQYAKVNPARAITGQILKVQGGLELGSTIPLPSGAAYTRLQSLGSVPISAEQRRECPLLLRAAAVYECGANPSAPGLATNYLQPATSHTSTIPPKMRCSHAEKIQIHLQLTQITEIAGSKPMKTMDTVLTPSMASKISIQGMVNRLTGGTCPKGTKLVGENCFSE